VPGGDPLELPGVSYEDGDALALRSPLRDLSRHATHARDIVTRLIAATPDEPRPSR